MATTLVVFRAGARYFLDPPAESSSDPVTLELAPDVELRLSAMKVPLLYRGYEPYGRTVEAAIQVGWARVVENPPDHGAPIAKVA